MIMSMSGAMPSTSTPMTEPVNSSGVVPEVTVRPWTGWSRVSADTGNGTAQSPVGSTDCAGLEVTAADARPSPSTAVSEARARPRRFAVVGFIEPLPFPKTKSWT
jgi:hypothetical protein